MALLGRPLPRFVVWAILLVGVAVATAAAALSWWLIALVELGAWAVVSLVERTLWHRSLTHPAAAHTRVVEPVVRAAPELLAPAPPIAPDPVRPLSAAGTAPRWNVWTLEKLAREHPEAEELEFLVPSLRGFADADGRLPADFDSLVRESFGELLAE